MMYPYITLADETEITHSQIIEVDGTQTVEVHFERPNENGFDSARCVLPSYRTYESKRYAVPLRFFSILGGFL